MVAGTRRVETSERMTFIHTRRRITDSVCRIQETPSGRAFSAGAKGGCEPHRVAPATFVVIPRVIGGLARGATTNVTSSGTTGWYGLQLPAGRSRGRRLHPVVNLSDAVAGDTSDIPLLEIGRGVQVDGHKWKMKLERVERESSSVVPGVKADAAKERRNARLKKIPLPGRPFVGGAEERI